MVDDMDMAGLSSRAAKRPESDGGMSLVEVMVSMVIIGIVFSSLGGVIVSSLALVRSTKDYQAATQLITRKLEQSRAVSFDTLQAGVSLSTLTTAMSNGSETRVTGGGPYYFEGARVLTYGSSTSGTTPLSPYREQVTVDGLTYALTTYPTQCWQPTDQPGTCNATQGASTDRPMIRVTVVADWNAPHSNVQRTLRTQSLMYSPDSCLDSSTHPFSAPCDDFMYASGGMGATVVIAGELASGDIVFGRENKAIALTLPAAGVSVQAEQTSTIKAGATGAAITVDDTAVAGTVSVSEQATNDPAGGSAGGTQALTAAAMTYVTPPLFGFSMTATGAAATGSATAVASATASPPCLTAAGATSTSARPCASASVAASGPSSVVLTGNYFGVSLDTTVASIAAGATASRAHAGTYVSPGSLCLSAAEPGCTAGDVASSSGAVVVGGLPAGVPAPAGWLGGAVLLDATSYSAQAERGVGAATVAAPTLSGTPTVRVWNGTAYTSYALASYPEGLEAPVAAVSATSGLITVNLAIPADPGPSSSAGNVNVASRAATSSGPADCATTCTAASSTSGITITVHYEILVATEKVAAFAVTTTLGELNASATFEPAATGGG
jgi:prepilin-type N-terminal cleavage/methylation domain-containing protein